MLPALISAGADILGGIMGSNSAEKAANKQAALQKEFAQNGIQWKVEDAKAAGLHPLAALGAQTLSYSPIPVGSDPLAAGISSAGQDISRAVDATRSASGKIDAYGKTVQDLNIRRMGLENEILASKLATTRQTGGTPPMPTAGDRHLIEGQAQSGLVNRQPLKVDSNAINQPSLEAGSITDMGTSRTTDGWAPVMSKDFKDRGEEDLGAMISWNIRNRILPSMGFNYNPPKEIKLDNGEMWYFNPIKQQYQKWRP